VGEGLVRGGEIAVVRINTTTENKQKKRKKGAPRYRQGKVGLCHGL